MVILDMGMYVFRYTTSSDKPSQSCISLHPAPIGKGSVDFFPGEGVSRNTLVNHGDYTVVRVKGAQASVLVTEYYPEGAAAINGQLHIDPINTAPKERSATKPVPPAAVTDTPKLAELLKAEQPRCSLKLQGHIERTGDVTVENTWLGDPNSQHRLEGFVITWNKKPEGLDLAYLCRNGKGSQPSVGLSGQYIGTRRQAKPITAVAFALSGPQASQYQLSGEVVFAGQPPQTITPDKELSGASGSEQLVAIDVVITAKTAQASPPASPWNDVNTTKIFNQR